MKATSIKGLLGTLLFESGVSSVLFRRTAIVVALHRVRATPTPNDGLTTPVEVFERYCRFFQRHFDVVPLSDLVRQLEHKAPLRRQLAITFDDGYRDNLEHAAPVLERLSLPATFFIVSDWMESRVVPWWDRNRGVEYPWMTWDDVRSLSRRGFEIGGHTRTHVNLGEIPPEQARGEIFGARAALERQLGRRVEAFAYPYGGRRNLTEANRELVKAAGFKCCCSCYGGINLTGADPFRLERVPISGWHASPEQFGFDVSFGRSVIAA